MGDGHAGGPEVVAAGGGIRLGQLLKLAGVVHTGGEAKAVLAAGEVTVNGAVEARRGAQLRAGDVVRCHGREVVVG